MHVDADNAFGDFWRLLAELAWRDYFDDPRTTSFGIADFDRFPEGNDVLPRAARRCSSRRSRSSARIYADLRLANDDTPILRALAAEERIHISPEFACVYSPRTTFVAVPPACGSSRRRSSSTGTARRESRFFPAVVAFFPLSAGARARRATAPRSSPLRVRCLWRGRRGVRRARRPVAARGARRSAA